MRRGHVAITRGLTVLTVAAALAGCRVSSTGPPPVAASVSAAPAARPDVAAVRQQLAELTVSAEDTGNHYRRADWPHWDQTGGGCDARENALRTQGQAVTTGPGCRITGGTWVSPYDGVTVTTPGALDVDHMVPLAEAARSGTRGWSRADRERYANDPSVLVAVTTKANRNKGDQDPARWLPAVDQCGYVARWTAVKHAYRMTVDRAERAAITAVLNHC
ncbi:HNH endonuclease family protein [Amycolatopsis sp. NPDC051106]|uniref:HNH endonuclease family protein n=1 Tax=unclassified Amycolatopsis TaxID=2618356 RepID=UPI0034441FB1